MVSCLLLGLDLLWVVLQEVLGNELDSVVGLGLGQLAHTLQKKRHDVGLEIVLDPQILKTLVILVSFLLIFIHLFL